MQSTPAGGLRDRQVAYGEAVSGARRSSWSKLPGANGASVGTFRVTFSVAGTPTHPVRADDPGAIGVGPVGRGGQLAPGFPPSAVQPREPPRSPGQEQGWARVARPWRLDEVGDGRPLRADAPTEAGANAWL